MSEKRGMKLDYFVTRYRLRGTKIIVIALLLLLMVSQSKWDPEGFIDILFEMLGLFFVIACTLGRIWVSMYIAGYKNRELITVGPYSIMRNPLYFFNLLGAIGLGFSSESLLVLSILLLTFSINYPLVVVHEERKLIAHYGNKYLDYMNRTPRFFPKLSIFHEPEKYLVDSRRYRQAFLDGFLFLYANGALALIERLHENHVLPNFFTII
jgi:protein-S-isoprenylcysteine O-methyltransferase Ste14